MDSVNTAPIISVKDLTKSYQSKIAVDCLSFTLNRGETLGLLGANGAGKTTTMHMLLGLLTPTSGQIQMFGKDFEKNRIETLRRCNFSSAYANLPSNLKVIQNLTVFGHMYGVKNLKKKIAELLEQLELTDFRDSITGHLSSGEATRLNLCKALLNDPEILLLDEPTASLDPDIADKVRKLLIKIQRERKLSVLYTSHNMKDIEEVCDRVIFVKRGKMITEGRPDDILQSYGHTSLEDVFIKIARDGEIIEEGNTSQ